MTKELDELTRARLKRELSWGASKPTADRYQRTTDLQRAILDQYGRRGAEFILEQQGLRARTDAGCPWPVAGMAPADAVELVFGELAAVLPRFVAVLQERVRWVIPARRDDAWMLAYLTDRVLHDGRPHFQLVLGGAPNASPSLSPRAQYMGWSVPDSLRRLCLVHDGICSGAESILSARRMADLGEIMAGIEEEAPRPSHACKDLLEFHPDGVGNCQAFFRRSSRDTDPSTVFWDHESNELSREASFFEYVDRTLSLPLHDEARS
ncbi:SMI1/KNR4 family protein [Massilia sp. PAMC28688]|uniref:SMI1/KNR4 family protein n=1 Tax=Massilia sp. PAMC28688 TaxID=2861283 RepID=UPI001C637D10|nr:SMI1/KNR4 family protein [Massilia sp. PAMC28688]QYF91689.1 SMI1/KNR4 family protein [Massilia sp. PAMC28688]